MASSMVDPLDALAITLHANPGVFAVLLGSGVSRSAQIPTGWEITLDLISRLAAMQGEDTAGDPPGWYRTKYGAEPDYSDLVSQVCKTPAERSQLLRPYIEPTEAEREQGLKLPTPAHLALGRLVASGLIKVVITPNFDPLTEHAIETAGATPSVLSTADAVEGALPLPHAGPIVLKVNGDYLDSRIKNSAAELSKYDKRLDRYLDRLFDEYGLIIVGWSSDWDVALKAAIERCKSRRFSTYWVTRSGPTESAQALIQRRGAAVIAADSADSFFTGLEEKVGALRALDRPHPLSGPMAVATVKTYLSDERHLIRLHDLVVAEAERVRNETRVTVPQAQPADFSAAMLQHLDRAEKETDILRDMLVAGAYWGRGEHQEIWSTALSRVADQQEPVSGLVTWISVRAYPALLLLYAAGIAAITHDRWDTLLALFNVRIRPQGEEKSAVESLYPRAVLGDFAKALPGRERQYYPSSELLFERTRESVRPLLPNDQDYQGAFDRFEYLSSLEIAHRSSRAPLGCFAYRRQVIDDVHVEAKHPDWKPLKVGLVGGTMESFTAAEQRMVRELQGVPSW